MQKILFTLMAIILWLPAGAAAQQKFPAWMDEVQFNNTNASKSDGFNIPQAPIDPATGKQSPISQSKNSAFGKPKLPDFSKMRDKAIKAELGKSYDASLQNIEQYKENKSKLETLLSANTGENERQELLKGIGELDQKIALSNEFIRMLGQSTGHAGIASAVASLTDTQLDRIRELQQLLFPQNDRQPIKSAIPEQTPVIQKPAVAIDNSDKEPSEEEIRQRRTYRPGRIKSFFIESKKAQQQNEENNPE